MSKDSKFVLFVTVALIISMFVVLALEQDKLNARIRELEIRAGLGDRWGQVKGKE